MTRHLLALALVSVALPAAAEERFRIRVDLTDEASSQLVELNEWITVSVSYYGEALPAAPETSWGRAWLGQEEVTVYPVSQVIEFGSSLSAMPVEWVEEPRVAVSIASGSSPEDSRLIVCDFMDQPLSALVENGETPLECVWAGDRAEE